MPGSNPAANRETVRKAAMCPEPKPQKPTKRARRNEPKKPYFAALEAKIEVPEATLDPFRTVSVNLFGKWLEGGWIACFW